MALSMEITNLKKFERLVQRLPKVATKAAALAINTSSRNARTQASRLIRQQVAFTAKYLNEPERLVVRPSATPDRLMAVLRARQRPTSLARFGKQATRKGKPAGVRVRVKPGGASKVIRQAFFVNLNNGNRGVAVREAVAGDLNLKRFGATAGKATGSAKKGKYILLYGPSVDQVFRTVKDDIAPGVSAFTQSEFRRQFARLAKTT